MRDRIIGALDTGCRRGEMMKIQNKHVVWQHRWIRILKENSKTEVARVIPFETGGRLEKLLRRRAFLGAEAYVFGEATTGQRVTTFRSAWETLLLLANGIEPTRRGRGQRLSNRDELARIDLHWHDLGTRRCPGWRTMACRFTNCRCSPATPASRQRSDT
jgi:integrase